MSVHDDVVNLLNELRKRVEAGGDGGIYGDRSRALEDIDKLLSSPSSEGVKCLILPTANLQELSLENGWGNEFIDLSCKLENLLGLS